MALHANIRNRKSPPSKTALEGATNLLTLSMPPVATAEDKQNQPSAEEAELFDDETLSSVLGPKDQVKWPDIALFGVLVSFDMYDPFHQLPKTLLRR